MSTLLEELDNAPAPLDFFLRDKIDPDNKAIIDQEQNRWRLLGRFERWKLERYVASLAGQLRKSHFNDLAREIERLAGEFKVRKDLYRHSDNDEDKARLKDELKAIRAEAGMIAQQLHELQPIWHNFNHYTGWLDYEAKNRDELREEAAREKKIEREMNREAKWLEQLILDVFRKTTGCHFKYVSKDKGKIKTRTPHFERSVIRPDAHYFYLKATSRFLFGYRWGLPEGVTVNRLIDEEVIQNLRAATKRQVDPVWTDTGQLMFRVSRLDSPDALPREVKWRDAMRFYPEDRRHKLPYCIGVADDRKFQWQFDLASNPHILVAGKSQSGKSNLVNGIIAALVSTHSPAELRVVLIDQKGGIEFTHFHELPHLLWDIIKTVDQVKPVLDRLRHVLDQRLAILERVKAKDIAAYNGRVDEDRRMARVLVVIDEMNTFVGLQGGLTEEIHNQLAILVSQGRAVGIHVITATQHPEVKVIPSRIKTNMDVRLCGPMPSMNASQIVIDKGDAAKLPSIPGRFIVVIGLMTRMVQVPRIFDEDIAGVVSSTQREYPDVPETLTDLQEQPAEFVVWDEQEVMKYALLWFDGKLFGEKMHQTLGDDSPGKRELYRIITRIKDQAEAVGYVEYKADGTHYKLKGIPGGSKQLVSISPVSHPSPTLRPLDSADDDENEDEREDEEMELAGD